MSIKLRVSPGALLTAALVVVLLGLQGGPTVAEAKTNRDQHWDEWRPLSQGFVARRRMPPNADKPVEQRRLAGTQKRYREPVVEQSAAGGGLARARALRAEEAAANRLGGSLRIPAWFPYSRRTPASSVWLKTGEPGLYTLKIEELAKNTGINAHLIRWFARTGRFTLLNAEQPVSWHFDSKTDTMWFAGEKYETFYSNINAYQLKSRATPDRNRMKVKKGRTRSAGALAPFRDTVLFEEEPDFFWSKGVVADEPDADYWFWDILFGSAKEEIEVALPLPDPAISGMAKLKVHLRGATDIYPGDDHQVVAEFNDVPVGSAISWDGFSAAELVAEFDQGLLRPDGDNTLRLRSLYAPGNFPVQYLDSVEMEYLRKPVAKDDRLWLKGVVGGVQNVTGFGSRDIQVIESPVRGAILRNDARVYRDGSQWAVAFPANADTDYLVVASSAFHEPLVDAGDSSDLRNPRNSADYLIIAPRDFAQTATALAEYRRSRFGSVRIAWLDEVYKEFGAGRTDPFAIGRFMRTVMEDWRQAPSMVILVGRGTLDHKDRMGYGDSFVPVLMGSNPWFLTGSDPRLVGFEDGNAPFGLGRLPITAETEGLAYVEKLKRHESAIRENENLAMVAADNPDDGGDFHGNSDELSTRILALGFDSVLQAKHPDQSVRTALTSSANWESASYVSYSGHGNVSFLGDNGERFLNVGDVGGLGNQSFPVFTALTCSAGDDTGPAWQSLASALVLNPDGGAIASLAPTGYSLDADAHRLGMAFVDSLIGERNTVGGATAEAKRSTSGLIRDFMSPMYSVIGDPAAYVR